MNPFELPPGNDRSAGRRTRHAHLHRQPQPGARQSSKAWLPCLPAVTSAYAVKANPHPGILEILADAGAGFDVASRGEIVAAVDAGANPRRGPHLRRHGQGPAAHRPCATVSGWTTSPSTTPRRSPRSPATRRAPTCTCGWPCLEPRQRGASQREVRRRPRPPYRSLLAAARPGA